jgi:hypothetical protein
MNPSAILLIVLGAVFLLAAVPPRSSPRSYGMPTRRKLEGEAFGSHAAEILFVTPEKVSVVAEKASALAAGFGRLVAFILLPVLLVRCLSRSRKLSRWLLVQAVRFIPADERGRYYWEWLANLQDLERYGLPTLGEAIDLLRAGARIGGRQRAELVGARTSKRARRLGPGWVGVLTSLGSFLLALSSFVIVVGASPTWRQLVLAGAGSILLGIVAGNQARPAHPHDR